MKIAILIQCHKNPQQINLLLERLNHPEYYKFYENTTCPDESFFHTLVMLSPYADDKTEYLTYLQFPKGANSPDILKACDLPKAKESKYLVMRKVDMNVDDSFLQI